MSTTGNSPILELRDLRRSFVVRAAQGRLRRSKRIVQAVDGITAAVAAGEACGYIGANGAGKSTTIKMLTGILVPSGGTVRTCGFDPVPDRRQLAREIGVVFGQRSQLWWDLPLAESLTILAAIHRIGARAAAPRIEQLVDGLELGAFLRTPVRQLSLGERMRGEVAAALVHRPRLLVLDEPTIGLDMISKERLRQFLVAERSSEGTTLLLTTHDMSDIERLCDRVLVVDQGRLVYDGTLGGLADRVALRRILVVDLTAPHPPLAVAGAEHVGSELDGVRQRLAFSPEETTAARVLAEVTAQVEVRDLTLEEPAIEDIVRTLYTRSRPGRTSTDPAAGPAGSGRGSDPRGRLVGDQDPATDVDQQLRAGQQHAQHEDQPDDVGADAEATTEPRAHARDHPVVGGAGE